MLRKEGPKKWIFDEYLNLSEMQFQFKDKETALSLVSSVVHSMQIYPMEEVLTAPYLISDWRPDLILDLMNDLIPEKCRILVVGQKIEPDCGESEFWYGTKYHSEAISGDVIQVNSILPHNILVIMNIAINKCVRFFFIKSWKDCGSNENLKFPEPNPFIPTDFTLYTGNEADTKLHPIILYDTPIMRVWFKQDTEFLKPKTIMNFDFSSPMAYSDPLNCNLTHMFVQLFKDQLNEYLYEAELAGLRFGVSNTANGISVSEKKSESKRVQLKKINNAYTFFYYSFQLVGIVISNKCCYRKY